MLAGDERRIQSAWNSETKYLEDFALSLWIKIHWNSAKNFVSISFVLIAITRKVRFCCSQNVLCTLNVSRVFLSNYHVTSLGKKRRKRKLKLESLDSVQSLYEAPHYLNSFNEIATVPAIRASRRYGNPFIGKRSISINSTGRHKSAFRIASKTTTSLYLRLRLFKVDHKSTYERD